MAKLVLCLVMLVAAAAAAAQRRHMPFPNSEAYGLTGGKGEYKKVTCGSDFSRERNKLIQESRCGEPKPVLIHLTPEAGHEQVSPGAVWVERCVGVCEFEGAGSCVAKEYVTRHIPLRVTKGGKEFCAYYAVQDHKSCGCCDLSPEKCGPQKVFNRRKCTCQCPNLEDRRDCLKQTNLNTKWNRSKCACEERRKVHT